ncbi:MAG: KpsF/GutQ family sugar-phosphate isomerase [Bacteroidia bacterium]
MKSDSQLKKIAVQTLETEAASINGLVAFIGDDFVKSVRLIYESKGRIIVTGIGKSAIIANKIVATLNSTGTPAVFMHAADAIHGDLGIIQKDDIVMCISKSGNTPEIKVLVPLLKNSGNKLIAVVGTIDSYLAQQSDFVLNTSVEKEACPNNLAPTSSSAAQMAMGDALAICLLEMREFSSSDFARFHPGGSLGKKLYLRISDLYTQNQKPEVDAGADIKQIIIEISTKRLGATAVVEKGKLIGIITDGDLRRMLQSTVDVSMVKASEIMTKNPKTISMDDMAVNALEIMKQNNITQLVVEQNGSFVGFIHLHDLIKEGII